MAYQARLRELGAELDSAMTARVGIHLGEVVLRENPPEDVARGAKPLEVEGLAKAIAARVMSLAGDGRILLTRTAYDFVRDHGIAPLDDDRYLETDLIRAQEVVATSELIDAVDRVLESPLE